MQSLLSLLFLASQLFCSKTAVEMRDQMNQRVLAIEAEKPEVYQVLDKQIGYNGKEVPIRIYTPNASKELPIVLLIHGGGWVAGSIETHDNMARYLCREAEVVIVSVGYTNAPEYKFPHQLEECYQALLWCQGQAQNSRLAVIGDSAGGNMAAALCLLARDRSGPRIGLQVLVNPGPDLTHPGTISERGDTWDRLRWFALQYVKDLEDTKNPYASPLLANLDNLPPAVVILAEKDELYEDGLAYAHKLGVAGVATSTYVQKGIGHLGGKGARASTQAHDSLNVAVKALRNYSLH